MKEESATEPWTERSVEAIAEAAEGNEGEPGANGFIPSDTMNESDSRHNKNCVDLRVIHVVHTCS